MEASQALAKPSKLRILIVEDDTNIARVLQLELEHEGFAVEVCGDDDCASHQCHAHARQDG